MNIIATKHILEVHTSIYITIKHNKILIVSLISVTHLGP